MDLDELLDGLDGEDIEDLFNRLRKRARAARPIMEKIARRIVLATPPGALGVAITEKAMKESKETSEVLEGTKKAQRGYHMYHPRFRREPEREFIYPSPSGYRIIPKRKPLVV
jgi:hypothetical protein